MAGRQYDILVFGATGFTGHRIVQHLASDAGFTGTWAIAGRDRSKLEALVASLGGGGTAPSVVVADVSEPDSLLAMARLCTVCLNTVGPFRLYGEPVVRACCEAGTHYLDVCGEPEFIERMELLYDDAAKAAGVYVASAVGFDSVPGDLGVQYTIAQFEPPARCTQVESALTIRGGPSGFRGHFPTYQSAVYGFASAGELRKLRKEAEQKRGKPDLKVPGPKLPRQTGAAWDERFNAWTFPFVGADASVVRRTMARIGSPANVSVVFTLPSRMYMTLWQGFGAAFAFLAQREWGRDLLLKYPRLFSYGMFTHEGPSDQQLAETTFVFTNIGRGYAAGSPASPDQQPDKQVITRVSGPEPAYIACSIFIVQAAITLLEDKSKLPAPGVHTPASLLWGTGYVDRLRAHGIKFEQVDSAAVQ